jgi:hypothetical protein
VTENPFTVEQHLGPFDNCHMLQSADYAGVYFLFRRRSIELAIRAWTERDGIIAPKKEDAS